MDEDNLTTTQSWESFEKCWSTITGLDVLIFKKAAAESGIPSKHIPIEVLQKMYTLTRGDRAIHIRSEVPGTKNAIYTDDPGPSYRSIDVDYHCFHHSFINREPQHEADGYEKVSHDLSTLPINDTPNFFAASSREIHQNRELSRDPQSQRTT